MNNKLKNVCMYALGVLGVLQGTSTTLMTE